MMEEERKMSETTKLIFNFNSNKGERRVSLNGVNETKHMLKGNKELFPFIEQIQKEVKKYPQAKRKRIMKLLQASTITLITMMQFTETSKAQTLSVYQPTNGKSNLLPPEIMDILKQLIWACEGIAVLLAAIFLALSGITWMTGNKAKSKQWTEDIVKGLGLTILAPVTILILVRLVSTIFKNTQIFEAFY